MKTLLVLDGDRIKLPPQFEDCLLTVLSPAVVRSSMAAVRVRGRRVCVERDVRAVRLLASYTTTAFPIPGLGEITIPQYAVAARSWADEQPLLVLGAALTARFTVTTPATAANPAATDLTGRTVQAQAVFQPSQSFIQAGEARARR